MDKDTCQGKLASVNEALINIINKFFNQVIEAHFYFKKDEILAQCEGWIKDSESLLSGRTVGRAISHHVQSLKQNTALLKQELAKLEPPPEHIPDGQDTDDDSDWQLSWQRLIGKETSGATSYWMGFALLWFVWDLIFCCSGTIYK